MLKENESTKRFDDIVLIAADKANELSLKYVYEEFVLWAFVKNETVKKFLKSFNVKYDELIAYIENFIETFPSMEHKECNDDHIELAEHVKVLKAYFTVCDKCNTEVFKDKNISFITNMIAAFLFMKETFAQDILLTFGINQQFLTMVYNKYAEDIDEKVLASFGETINNTINNNSDNTNNPLDVYTSNLTNKVKSDEWVKIIGREKELNILQQINLRHDKPNVIIVGNNGVGKTKLVEGLAYIYSKQTPTIEVYQLDTMALMSNILLKGELENRVKGIFNVLKTKPNSMLFIDDIHMICGNSEQSSTSDVSTLLKPILEDGKIKIIGTTSFEDYRKYIEKDTSFARKFFKLILEDPTKEETRNILTHIKYVYENSFGTTCSDEIIEMIMDISEKYYSKNGLPDLEKCIDIMDMSGALAKFNNEKEITETLIYKTVSMLLNIPLSNVSQSEEEIYQHLEENIKKEIIGQDEAVEKVADAVIISRSGLRETNKTASTLMFMGESGVGKTEICKVLSKIMNIPLVRFDMSEYIEDHSVSKLLGSPPGYKGFSDGKAGNGLLINAIDEHPHCILLLDEIEKANSKIHNILLQVMDNGSITSSSGKSVSFANAFLVMTSNVGSYNTHKRRIGFGNDDSSPSDDDYNERFLPEFRNRIDATVKFNSLSKDVLKSICNKFLTELKEILSKKGIDFCWNDDIIDYIVGKVNRSGNGARPMKHIITNEIKNKIGKQIVFGNIKDGGKINLSIKDGEIIFGGINEN